jgi:hypothetical protein
MNGFLSPRLLLGQFPHSICVGVFSVRASLTLEQLQGF